MNRDFRLWPAVRENGEEGRKGCEEDMTLRRNNAWGVRETDHSIAMYQGLNMLLSASELVSPM